jgi:predicted esterase
MLGIVALVCSVPLLTATKAEEFIEHGPGRYHLAHAPETLVPVVTFLSAAPEIDGVLDDDLDSLPVGRFSELIVDGHGPEMHAADRASVTAAQPTYRFAYGTDFFYLYVEAPGERLHFRDRAYQNGDGFSLMLGATRPDNASTDEFYVLSCSAVNDARMEWTRRVFWYYNVDDIFVRTSPETQLEFKASGSKISFELYLPWHDVHPHHPWFAEGIGFNLRFVKGIGEGTRYKYIVLRDGIGSEYRNRLYVPLEFEEPHVDGPPQTFFVPERNHIQQGAQVRGVAVTAAAGPCEEKLDVSVSAGWLKRDGEVSARYACARGLTRHELDLRTTDLKPGEYQFKWSTAKGNSKGKSGLTVLPAADFGSLVARLDALAGWVSPGTITTLQWNVENLRETLAGVRPYETCESERKTLDVILERIAAAEAGKDPYADRNGFFRRAHRSKLDDSLQPYTVIIPDKLDRSRTYPLIVFLHGSASDETNLGGFRDLVPEGTIGLGPRGRGFSNLFCFDYAQADIAESIDDVIANYPVDTSRIILTGFSMGGYGVYRTFYETPEKFCALVILSGKPSAGGVLRSPDTLDLLEGTVGVLDFRLPENLKPFAGMPVFVHHGEKDRNCPYQTMVEQVDRLRTAEARVEFISDPELGHEAPSRKTYDAYHKWLASVLEKK